MLNVKQRMNIYGLFKANSHIKERIVIVLLRSVAFVKVRAAAEKSRSAFTACGRLERRRQKFYKYFRVFRNLNT
jgi:hypothetical protein